MRDAATLVLATVALTAASLDASARNASEALGTAQCVRSAIKEATKLLSPSKAGDEKSAERRAELGRELDAVNSKEQEGVKRCLNEADVFNIGWFSYFQDYIVDCDAFPSKALEGHRQEDDAESDLINGAASWAAIPERGNLSAHPFFAGQEAARVKFKEDIRQHSYAAVCQEF